MTLVLALRIIEETKGASRFVNEKDGLYWTLEDRMSTTGTMIQAFVTRTHVYEGHCDPYDSAVPRTGWERSDI